jgi:CBS domain-containing protein
MTQTVRRNAVRRCTVLSADGSDAEVRTVFCPRRERSEAFEKCCGCSHMREVGVDEGGERGFVDCSVPAPRRAQDDDEDGELGLKEAAAGTRLMDVMADDVACVREDVRLADAARLMLARSVRALPVVDEARRLVGILSKSDLVRGEVEGKRADALVSSVMTPLVHGLPEDAPLAYAISLMSNQSLHEVPAVASDGRVVGMLTAVDALRWIARGLGYVQPGPKPAR